MAVIHGFLPWLNIDETIDGLYETARPFSILLETMSYPSPLISGNVSSPIPYSRAEKPASGCDVWAKTNVTKG